MRAPRWPFTEPLASPQRGPYIVSTPVLLDGVLIFLRTLRPALPRPRGAGGFAGGDGFSGPRTFPCDSLSRGLEAGCT